MATAEKTTIERVVEDEGFQLSLSVAEAETLIAVITVVGGSRDTPREHTDSVYEALKSAGVRDWCKPGWGVERWGDHPSDLISGRLTFSEGEGN